MRCREDGGGSDFNDTLSWDIKPTNLTPITGNIDVNDRHTQWQDAEIDGLGIHWFFPVHTESTTIITAPVDAPIDVKMDLKATNIEDATHHSTVLVGLLPVVVNVYRPQVTQEAVAWTLNRNETVIPENEISDKGVGIRVNLDDDNNNTVDDANENGPSSQENDLIEVEFLKPTVWPDWELIIKKPALMKVWADKNKTNIVAGNDIETVVDPTQYPPRSYWVECTDVLEEGELEFLLRPKNGGDDQSLYSVPFHSFNSFIVGLSGEISLLFNDPPETSGMYKISEALYLSGYNISYYDEDLVNGDGSGIVHDEIKEQVNKCHIARIGAFGHSHGGGSVYDLCDKLFNDMSIPTFHFTGYVDAVKQGLTSEENRFPLGSAYLLNYYQTAFWDMNGEAIPGADNHDMSSLLIEHTDMDDYPVIRDAFVTTIKSKITNP